MVTKRTGLKMNLAFAGVLVAGILIIINFISVRRFLRIDLTEDQQFTISQATRNILGNLKDLVTIKVFQSQKNLPAQWAPHVRRVRDVLSEFHAHALGKIQISYINPDDDPDVQAEADRLGVRELQVQVMEQDQFRTAIVRFGLVVIYAANNKSEAISDLSATSNLEYDLTSAIIKVTTRELKKIAFLTGHNERDIYKDYSTVRQLLQKHYTVTTHDPSKGTPVPEDVNTLIVAGPKEITDRSKYEIDQFIMKGGRAVFLIDSINVPAEIPYGVPVTHNIGDLLEHYGVKLNKDVVMDVQFNLMYTYRQGPWHITMPHPALVKVLPFFGTDKDGKEYYGFSAGSPVTQRLDVMVFPVVSSVEAVKERLIGKEVTELVKSSPVAWTETKDYNLSPDRLSRLFPASEQKQHLLAVSIAGEFTSFFKGKPIPEAKVEDEDPAPVDPDRKTIEQSPPTHIVVMGDSDFLLDDYASLHNATMPFFLNLIDWLTLSPDMASIRARELTYRPLKETTSGQRLFYKLLMMVGIPLLVVVFGIVRFAIRHSQKSPYALSASGS